MIDPKDEETEEIITCFEAIEISKGSHTHLKDLEMVFKPTEPDEQIVTCFDAARRMKANHQATKESDFLLDWSAIKLAANGGLILYSKKVCHFWGFGL